MCTYLNHKCTNSFGTCGKVVEFYRHSQNYSVLSYNIILIFSPFLAKFAFGIQNFCWSSLWYMPQLIVLNLLQKLSIKKQNKLTLEIILQMFLIKLTHIIDIFGSLAIKILLGVLQFLHQKKLKIKLSHTKVQEIYFLLPKNARPKTLWYNFLHQHF